MAADVSFKEPRQWKFNKTKINPLYKEEKPIGIAFDHASKLNIFKEILGGFK